MNSTLDFSPIFLELEKVIFEYGSQIGVWLSGAFLAQRFFTVFVWDGVIAGISGRPVPRLPKDFTGMLFFGIAGMGVVGTVFDKSITGIWATSWGFWYRSWHRFTECNPRCVYRSFYACGAIF
jgi:hypothetical protein